MDVPFRRWILRLSRQSPSQCLPRSVPHSRGTSDDRVALNVAFATWRHAACKVANGGSAEP